MLGPSADILRTREGEFFTEFWRFLFFLFGGDNKDDDYSYEA